MAKLNNLNSSLWGIETVQCTLYSSYFDCLFSKKYSTNPGGKNYSNLVVILIFYLFLEKISNLIFFFYDFKLLLIFCCVAEGVQPSFPKCEKCITFTDRNFRKDRKLRNFLDLTF